MSRGKPQHTHQTKQDHTPEQEPPDQPLIANQSDDVQVQDFQQFYQEHISLMYRYVYTKVGNREEAEDLTSLIFMKAVRGLDLTRGQPVIRKWLFQVARTTIADYWRSYYRVSVNSLEELLNAGWEGPVDESMVLPADGPDERVQRILQALSGLYRDVLTCRFLLNLSVKETALRLGLTESNVKVAQFRALKRAASLEVVISERIDVSAPAVSESEHEEE